MATTIPELLVKCFIDLDFLAGIKDNQKANFRKRYCVEKDGWSGLYGSFWRTFENERLNVSGISEIRSICATTFDLYKIYKNNKVYGPKFTSKILAAKRGLERLEQTYKSIGKTVEASQIRNSAIIDLESILPPELNEEFSDEENEEL